MAETTEWAFPERLQPRQENLRFNLEAALQSVVQVHSEVPDEAFTASVLGTERMGHGVVIGSDGLVLTIGYLITEAESIWLTTNEGAVVPGHALAYDQVTSFGLVLPLGRLDVPTMQRGSVVRGLTQGGPAQRAGVKLGDVLLEVGGEPVSDLAELFRKVWRVGPAGSEIAMTLARGRNTSQVRVTSADREDFLKKPRRH